MKDNQCHQCYRFCRYEDMDSFTPFGCANYEEPEPFDPTYLCKVCSEQLKQEYIKRFKEGNYKYGDWCKSRAEHEAAKECGLVWVSNNSSVEYNGKRAFNEYIPKEIYENTNALLKEKL